MPETDHLEPCWRLEGIRIPSTLPAMQNLPGALGHLRHTPLGAADSRLSHSSDVMAAGQSQEAADHDATIIIQDC